MLYSRITDKKDLLDFLKDVGYSKQGGSKHEKWSKDNHTVLIPRHKNVCRMIIQRLAKEIYVRNRSQEQE